MGLNYPPLIRRCVYEAGLSTVWWSIKEWVLSYMSYPKSVMRKRKEILEDGRLKNDLIIEVLLDIRDILVKATKKKRVVRADRKRPTKTSV
ncbi:hypothetical protein LCGC14_2337240 [marine sediment metagenome]|uniref:Uncharacterized protein n=1 Tax=marine sediment metagenome TaxID=412755 RepID=A0A0F9CE14_9ZZZZ